LCRQADRPSSCTSQCLGHFANPLARYNIPGELGSIDEGFRLLNFCWYTNQDPSGLADVMTDADAIHHHTSVPAGKVRASIWARQRELAHSLFIPPYLEVIEKIASPFIHLITDYWSPQASFANGKVLLIGDASALMRPHIAFSTNQAAFQCMLVVELVKGELSSRTWDWQITRFTYLHWRRSVWFGEYFQRPLYSSLFAAVSYWAAAAVQTARYWSGTMPQAGA